MLEKHMLFRANLNLELFEKKAISEEIVRSYNELKFEKNDGKKSYFEFFFWVSRYLIQNDNDYEIFKSVVNTYKSVNSISDKDEEFILLSFKINQLSFGLIAQSGNDGIPLIDKAIKLSSEIGITDKNTLLVLQRLKLRYLLRNEIEMNSALASEIKIAKNSVEEILAQLPLNTSGKKEGTFNYDEGTFNMNSILLS